MEAGESTGAWRERDVDAGSRVDVGVGLWGAEADVGVGLWGAKAPGGEGQGGGGSCGSSACSICTTAASHYWGLDFVSFCSICGVGWFVCSG